MMLGVPIVPMVISFGTITLLAVWINFFLFLLFIPIYIIMRGIVKNDDQQFRLLGLKAKCRMLGENFNRNALFWKSSAYAPIKFHKRKYQ